MIVLHARRFEELDGHLARVLCPALDEQQLDELLTRLVLFHWISGAIHSNHELHVLQRLGGAAHVSKLHRKLQPPFGRAIVILLLRRRCRSQCGCTRRSVSEMSPAFWARSSARPRVWKSAAIAVRAERGPRGGYEPTRARVVVLMNAMRPTRV